MNAPEHLDLARTALLFFDMLNGHVKKNDPATKAPKETITGNSCSASSRAWRACAPARRSCACWRVDRSPGGSAGLR
jgi:squalene cyclase